MPAERATYESVARELLGLLDADALADLRSEDPSAAVELHLDPVRVQALPARDVFDSQVCSTDGFYDADIDLAHPWIFFADDVAEARARFTIVHEVAHHLIYAKAPHLLDAIDRLGSDAQAAEEQVCHAFAGLVLVPDEFIDEQALTPGRIQAVKDACGASWEATVVRLVGATTSPQAVLLFREPGVVSFGASSRSLGASWWERGARVDPHGPLRSALGRNIVAQADVYRYGLGGAQRMFVDSLTVHPQLAVAVLSRQASDGHFEVLVDPEPSWKDDARMCLFCPGERGTGWCELCSGRLCDDCNRCGCAGVPTAAVRCTICRQEPQRPGSEMCRTCESTYM